MEADQRNPYCPPGESSARTYSSAQGSSPGPTKSYSSPDQPQHPDQTSPPKVDHFRRALDLLGEYKEYASYYMATKLDGMKGSMRNLGIYAGLGIAGLIAFSALITTAVALFLIGAAMGIAHLFDTPKYWLGALLVGFLVLALIGVGAVVGLKKVNAGFRKAAENKYEQRKRWQRGQFGRDVEQAAATTEKAGS